MDYARTKLVAHYAFTCCWGTDPGYLIHDDIAENTGFVYVTPAVSKPFQVLRFLVTNVTSPTVYNLTINNKLQQFQMAIDISRNLGFLVGQTNPFVEVFDLMDMTFVTKFNYTQGKYPFFLMLTYLEAGVSRWTRAVASSTSELIAL